MCGYLSAAIPAKCRQQLFRLVARALRSQRLDACILLRNKVICLCLCRSGTLHAVEGSVHAFILLRQCHPLILICAFGQAVLRFADPAIGHADGAVGMIVGQGIGFGRFIPLTFALQGLPLLIEGIKHADVGIEVSGKPCENICRLGIASFSQEHLCGGVACGEHSGLVRAVRIGAGLAEILRGRRKVQRGLGLQAHVIIAFLHGTLRRLVTLLHQKLQLGECQGVIALLHFVARPGIHHILHTHIRAGIACLFQPGEDRMCIAGQPGCDHLVAQESKLFQHAGVRVAVPAGDQGLHVYLHQPRIDLLQHHVPGQCKGAVQHKIRQSGQPFRTVTEGTEEGMQGLSILIALLRLSPAGVIVHDLLPAFPEIPQGNEGFLRLFIAAFLRLLCRTGVLQTGSSILIVPQFGKDRSGLSILVVRQKLLALGVLLLPDAFIPGNDQLRQGLLSGDTIPKVSQLLIGCVGVLKALLRFSLQGSIVQRQAGAVPEVPQGGKAFRRTDAIARFRLLHSSNIGQVFFRILVGPDLLKHGFRLGIIACVQKLLRVFVLTGSEQCTSGSKHCHQNNKQAKTHSAADVLHDFPSKLHT